MGMRALKLEPEGTVEESVVVEIKERLVRVETNVEHIREDVTELKQDVKQIMPAIADLKVGLEKNRVWFLLQLFAAGTAAVAGAGLVAKAFKWI